MSETLVRTHPIDIYYVTGQQARDVRENAADTARQGPCFCTASFGLDGFSWDTAEEFERDWVASFGSLDKKPADGSLTLLVTDDRCDHPWHGNPGLITPCPQCGATR